MGEGGAQIDEEKGGVQLDEGVGEAQLDERVDGAQLDERVGGAQLDEGIGRGAGNSAHVLLVSCNFDISLVAPGGSPAVLDQPVGLAGPRLHAVPDGQDTVVQVLRAALLLPVDTVAVELEGLVASIDCHTAGTLGGDSLHQLILVALLDVDKPDVPGALVLGLIPALVVLALVGIGLLGIDATVILDVLEGVVHEAAVATLVAVGPAAVDQVLLTQAGQLSSLPVVHGFQGSGGGEGPADL